MTGKTHTPATRAKISAKVAGRYGTEASHFVHGMSCTPIWYSWSGMFGRCDNPRHPRYSSYGGRGITICDRWRGNRGFVHFLADMGERPEGLTLDRVDNDRGYSPGNCRWATPKQQANNRRKARKGVKRVEGVRARLDGSHGG